MEGKNMQRLSYLLTERMKQTSNAAVPTMLELGTVKYNGSIVTDSLKVSIPKGEYMISRFLYGGRDTLMSEHEHKGGEHGGHEGGNGSHTHDGGEHVHGLPERFDVISPGDRVLVAWCGNEPVVVSIVMSSSGIRFQ